MSQELKQAAHEIRMGLTPIIQRHMDQDTPAEWKRWYLDRMTGFGYQAGLMEAYTFAASQMEIPAHITEAYQQAQAALQNLREVIEREVA